MEKIHPETGEFLRRGVRLIEFSFKGEKFKVNMPGWYPADNDNELFTQEDMKVTDAAVDALITRQNENLQNNFSAKNVSA